MMQEIVCPETGDRSYRFTAACGMTVHVIPRPFHSVYAALGVGFGSFDTSFRDVNGEVLILPGSAHLLEHKMFDMVDGGDAFELFAPLGANANAFTSHEYTAYVFHCTEHAEDALRALLSFVSSPCISDENIRKEVGIIEQEICAYRDDASYRSYMRALSLMYTAHPIREDIAGSGDGIRKITADTLLRIYRHFYRADNMVLTVAGDLSPHRVSDIIDAIFGTVQVEGGFVRAVPSYDDSEGVHTDELRMDLPMPHVTMTYKNRAMDLAEQVTESYCLDIGAACLFGRTSELYRRLFEGGLVSRDFDGYYEWSWGAGHMVLSFDTDYPQLVTEFITDHLQNIDQHMPTKEQFESMRRVAYADAVAVFDNVTDTALSDLEETICGGDYFMLPSLIKNLSYNIFCHKLKSIFIKNTPFIVTVYPRKDKEI